MESMQQALTLLARQEIFSGVSQETLADFLHSAARVEVFARGAALQQGDVRFLALLLRGRARVFKGDTVISELREGELFGAVTLFGDFSSPATRIAAAVQCELLILPQDAVEALLAKEPALARAYIAYLSGRIHFLTRRIADLSSGSVSQRLLRFLRQGGEETLPSPNCTVLAKELGVGRATLYRALSELEQTGAIRREGNCIVLLKDEEA